MLLGGSKRVLYLAASSLLVLFASFIAIGGLFLFYPSSATLRILMDMSVLLCAVVSVATCIVSLYLLPTVIKVLAEAVLRGRQVELNESYLFEIIDMLKESVIVLSAEGNVMRGNAVSTHIFGPGFSAGQHLPSLVLAEDRKVFNNALKQHGRCTGFHRIPRAEIGDGNIRCIS
jgi:hypothetical protein